MSEWRNNAGRNWGSSKEKVFFFLFSTKETSQWKAKVFTHHQKSTRRSRVLTIDVTVLYMWQAFSRIHELIVFISGNIAEVCKVSFSTIRQRWKAPIIHSLHCFVFFFLKKSISQLEATKMRFLLIETSGREPVSATLHVGVDVGDGLSCKTTQSINGLKFGASPLRLWLVEMETMPANTIWIQHANSARCSKRHYCRKCD